LGNVATEMALNVLAYNLTRVNTVIAIGITFVTAVGVYLAIRFLQSAL
jgi:hypothetical protein